MNIAIKVPFQVDRTMIINLNSEGQFIHRMVGVSNIPEKQGDVSVVFPKSYFVGAVTIKAEKLEDHECLLK